MTSSLKITAAANRPTASHARRRTGGRGSTPQAQALSVLNALTPRPWDHIIFLQRLGTDLGRPVVVHTSDMPSEMTGVWMSTATADYVFVTSNADSTRWITIVAHEVAHILLHHQLRSDPGSPIGQLGFASDAEHDAEMVATAFVAQLEFDGRVPAVSATG